MATDLTVVMQDRPGGMAQIGETLGRAGINIEGACGVVSGGQAIGHILVEDAAAARKALEAAGIKVSAERPVLIVPVVDRIGEMGRTARQIANAGVNIEAFYLSTKGQVVLATDSIEKAQAALKNK